MRKLIFYFKPVAIVLSFSILIQSCVVYCRQGSTINRAIDSGEKVKCIMSDNRIFYYDKIITEKNEIIGISKKHGLTFKVYIPKENVKEIYLMNEKASNTTTVLLIIGLSTGLLGAGVYSFVKSLENFRLFDTGF